MAIESSLKMMKNAFSNRKGNQPMTFSQLIDLTWETFSLKNRTQNVTEKSSPDPYLNNSLLLLYHTLRVRNILRLSCRPLAFTWCQAYLKIKKSSGTIVSLPQFLHNLWKKYFSCYSLLIDHCIVWLLLLHEIFGNMYITIVC